MLENIMCCKRQEQPRFLAVGGKLANVCYTHSSRVIQWITIFTGTEFPWNFVYLGQHIIKLLNNCFVKIYFTFKCVYVIKQLLNYFFLNIFYDFQCAVDRCLFS